MSVTGVNLTRNPTSTEAHTRQGVGVDARRQPAGVSSVLYCVGSGDQSRPLGLCQYLLGLATLHSNCHLFFLARSVPMSSVLPTKGPSVSYLNNLIIIIIIKCYYML